MALKKFVKTTPIEKEVKQVEKYEYLLVEYLKEISNEITYLVLVVCSLFLYVMLDLLPAANTPNYEVIRIIFILLIIGGFGLFGMSNITKRRIEKRFEQIFL
ncbi:hypothetical protein H0N95_00855 [Candidatus Micrarchaeota archaeon]|nr:hypothetical protein [Candidatus Micrarchaeota archaeon]